MGPRWNDEWRDEKGEGSILERVDEDGGRDGWCGESPDEKDKGEERVEEKPWWYACIPAPEDGKHGGRRFQTMIELRSSRTDAESGHLGGAGRIISECRLLAAINHGLSGSSVSGGPAWVAHETPCPHSVTARDPALYLAVMSKRNHTGRSDLLKFHRPKLRLDNAPIPALKPESKQYVHEIRSLPGGF